MTRIGRIITDFTSFLRKLKHTVNQVSCPCHPALDAGSPEQRTPDYQGIAGQARNDRMN
jgi:hypothetical protein